MLKQISFIALLLFAQAATCGEPFTDAVNAGKIKVHIESKGGYNGRCVAVHFEKLTRQSLQITIPAGHVFVPVDSSIQPIIVLKEENFTLDKDKQFIRVQGVCAKANRSSPIEKDTFNLGALAKGNLLKMAQYIAQNRLWNEGDAQYAIWAFTDSFNVAGINHPGLLSTACSLLGVAKPQYGIVHAPPVSRAPQQRVRIIEPETFAYKGEFEYQSNQQVEISVIVLNEQGVNVRTVVAPRPHLPGRAQYSFYFKTTQLPKGKYQICFTVDGKTHKKIDVRY